VKEKLVLINVKVSPTLDRQARIAAAVRRVSKSEILRRALTDWLARHGKGEVADNG